MNRDTITLYLTEARAFEAAEKAMEKLRQMWKPGPTFRVLAATLRGHDGTVDHGFKVMIVPPRFIGDHPYYL